jgi:hypothetical protein
MQAALAGCGSDAGDSGNSNEPAQPAGSAGSTGVSTTGTGGSESATTGTGGSANGNAGSNPGQGGSGPGAGGSPGVGGSAPMGTGGSAGAPPMVTAQGCPADQAPGTWKNVSDPMMNLVDDYHGPITVGVDVVHPSDVYVHAMGDGTWKSSDCGVTWKKVSTGMNGDKQNSGRQWFATIDTNPHRDPSTAPTLYVTQGYGAGSVWKSTNGGVDWANVWDNNIFAEDGVTNISKDVGNDISGVFLVDSSGPDHLIVYLHSYYGMMGNNGVFESKDGAKTWIVHKAATFNFQPHSDILFPFDATTWMVTHGTSWPSAAVYRTTDSGTTWKTDDGMVSVNLGRSYFKTDAAIYGGTDYTAGVYKSTDKGLTWTALKPPGNAVSWVAATKTKLYASNDRSNPHIFHASLDADTKWTDDGAPGMAHGGANTPGVIFDGSHYVLVVPEERGGVWRYVEP